MPIESMQDLNNSITEEKKKDEVKLEIHKVQIDSWSKLIALFGAIVGGTLAFLGYYYSKENPDQRQSYLIILFVGVGFSVLFFLFFFLYTKRALTSITRSYGNLNSIIKIFIALEEVFKEKQKTLDDQIYVIKEAARNIANSPWSHLISWHQSSCEETDAQRVFSISIDLSWINNEEKLNEIFEDLMKKEEDKYFFIVVSNSESTAKNIKDIDTWRQKVSSKISNFDRRFQIKRLWELKIGGVEMYKTRDYLYLLPIPNDVVIYKKGPKRTVVISTSTIKANRSKVDLHSNFDVKFLESEQVDRIEYWFKNTWKELTNEDIYGE